MRLPLPRPAAALLAFAAFAAQAGEVTVSAAASLTHALREIAPLYERAHAGATLRLNFGASGALMVQIAKGAPVDVFASADAWTMDQAQAQGLLKAGARRDLVSNTLVVVVPAAAAALPKTLAELATPAYGRIAIGQPASVPVGRYTKDTLEAAGLWAAIAPKTVSATTVRQALDYVARAEAGAGFVYATDAAIAAGKVKIAFTVPTGTPIRYPVAPLAAAPNPAGAAAFVDFLFTPGARAVFARHGFGAP